MHLKYLHYFGNESNGSLLEAYGIIDKGIQLNHSGLNNVLIAMNLTSQIVGSVQSVEWCFAPMPIQNPWKNRKRKN